MLTVSDIIWLSLSNYISLGTTINSKRTTTIIILIIFLLPFVDQQGYVYDYWPTKVSIEQRVGLLEMYVQLLYD